jgi:hypothetical protein
MASYYYLIASLPELKSDSEMPITYDEFLSYCETAVESSVYEELKNLTLSSDKGPLVSKWAKFYKELTKEVNYQRSLRLGKQYEAPEFRDHTAETIASAALSAKNPLEAEQILLDYEFENLDSLVGLHMFDKHVLFGYAIKLKLLERQGCFEHEKGKAEFKKLFDQVQQQVYSL